LATTAPTNVQPGRAWAWVGIAAAVLGIVATWAVQFAYSSDDLDAGGQILLDAIESGNNETLYRVTSGLGYIAVACLVWFAIGLRRLLEERRPGTHMPNIMSASMIATAGALIVAFSFRAQVFDGIDSYGRDPAVHITINRLQQDTVLSVWAGLGAATAAAAYGAFREQLLPMWLGWVSAIVTVLIAVLVLVGLAFPANVPALLWLLLMAIWAVGQRSSRGS
jgi:hypothetical protein